MYVSPKSCCFSRRHYYCCSINASRILYDNVKSIRSFAYRYCIGIIDLLTTVNRFRERKRRLRTHCLLHVTSRLALPGYLLQYVIFYFAGTFPLILTRYTHTLIALCVSLYCRYLWRFLVCVLSWVDTSDQYAKSGCR